MQNSVNDGTTTLYMIESIDAENNTITIADYVYDIKIVVPVNNEKISLYAIAFDTALESNLFLSVEYDAEKGEIVG